METKELNVTGMDCGGCENAINNALSQLDGVESSTAEWQSGVVRVTFDPARVGLEAISTAIADAGYEVASA